MNIRESDREALSQLATTRDCSVDDLVHEAIAHYLKGENPLAPMPRCHT